MPRHKDEVVASASAVVVVADEVVMGSTDRHSPSHVIGHRSGPSGLKLHKAGTTKKVAQNGISSAQGRDTQAGGPGGPRGGRCRGWSRGGLRGGQ